MSNIKLYFENPWLLLVIIPLVALALLPVIKLPKARRFTTNRKISLGLHLGILTVLVLLLSGVTFYQSTEEVNTIILIDASHSAEISEDLIASYVEEIAATATEETKVGVVAFSNDYVYVAEFAENAELLMEQMEDNKVQLDQSATNMETALYYAESLLDDGANQRIILISDGFETDGNAREAAKIIADRGVQIDAICVSGNVVEEEIQVKSLLVDMKANLDEEMEISVIVESNHEGETKVQFYDNGIIIHEAAITVAEGLNEYTITYTPETSGVHEFCVGLNPEKDTVEKNNTAYAYMEVAGLGDILIIEGTENASNQVADLLSVEYNVTVISSEECEAYANLLPMYQEVVLMNVSNEDLPEGFAEKLESYVGKYGGGLLTTGGANTYAYGSMTETIFEDMLPIKVESEEKKTTALMIVVDASNSMSGTNQEMAIEGTIACIEALSDTDYVGVLTFNSTVHIISEMKSMKYKEEIISAVEKISLSRGTYMTEATQEAYDQLKNFDADIKHVIILSDGNPQDSGYAKVVRMMAANNITVSTIAVGTGSYSSIMSQLAEIGGGNFYSVKSATDLPEIMITETESAVGNYKNIGSFSVNIASYSTVLNGVDAESLPAIEGYITTFEKSDASLLLTIGEGDPLYAQWDYGNGRVGSFTSDFSAEWCAELLDTEDGARLLCNIVERLLQADGEVSGLYAETILDNYQASVEVTARIGDVQSIDISILTPEGETKALDVILTTRGTYTASYQVSDAGIYSFNVIQYDEEGNATDYIKKNIAFSYSEEYDVFTEQDGEATLEAICEVAGGTFAYSVDAVKDFSGDSIEYEMSPTLPLLILTMILFLCDIAIRKFQIKWSTLFKK